MSDAIGLGGTANLNELLMGLVTGIGFGLLLQMSGASSYRAIVNMLRLKELYVLKFWFLAIGVGSVGIYLDDAFGIAHIYINEAYLLGVAAAGLIFGVGWGLSGYCPGTSLAAVGQGKTDAMVTVLGGLVGTFALTLCWDALKPALVDPLNFGPKRISELLNLNPLLTAVGLLAFIAAFLWWLSAREKARTSGL